MRQVSWVLAEDVQQAEGACLSHGLRAIAHVQFAVDVVEVRLDRALGDEELLGDLLVRQTLGDQGEDLALALAQRLDQRRLCLPDAGPFAHVCQSTRIA